MKIKAKPLKRLISGTVAATLALTMIPTSAFAATTSILVGRISGVSYSASDSTLTGKNLKNNTTYNLSSLTEDGFAAYETSDGKTAYALGLFNAGTAPSYTATEASNIDSLTNLTSAQRTLLNDAAPYLYQGATTPYSGVYTVAAQRTASQLIIFEIINNGSLTDDAYAAKLLATVKAESTSLKNEINNCYNAMKADILKHHNVPSFAVSSGTAPTHSATYNYITGKYEVTLPDDTTGTLNQFGNFTSSDFTATYTVTGNRVKIESDSPMSGTVYFDRLQSNSRGNLPAVVASLISSTESEFISNFGYAMSFVEGTRAKGYFNINTVAAGSANVTVKPYASNGTVNTAVASDVTFKLKNVMGEYVVLGGSAGSYSYNGTSTTGTALTANASGTVNITGLVPGTYTICDISTPAGYANKTQTAELVVTSGGTATADIVSEEKTGELVLNLEGENANGNALTAEQIGEVELVIKDEAGRYFKATKTSDGKYTFDSFVTQANATVFKFNTADKSILISGIPSGDAGTTYTVNDTNRTTGFKINTDPDGLNATVEYGKGVALKPTVTQKIGNVTIEKEFVTADGSEATTEQLAALEFKVIDTDGNYVVATKDSDGVYSYTGEDATGTVFKLNTTTKKFTVNGLPSGESDREYRVVETKNVPGYAVSYADDKEDGTHFVILTDQTVNGVVTNTQNLGKLVVNKTAEDDVLAGHKFTVVPSVVVNGGSALYNLTTDSTGTATLDNLPVYDDAGNKITYTITEVEVDARYVVPAAQETTLLPNDTTTKEFRNVLKKFSVTVTKADSGKFTANANGDATLEGAVYGLYNADDDTLVAQYTTDENGQFTTDVTVCGSYYIKEITPSQGYNLDTTKYPVKSEASNFTGTNVEENTAEDVDVTEVVIDGQIEIRKHLDKPAEDGANNINGKVPEEGAVFQIYLTSAGSYENATDAERDTITTDENGYAITKKLPYGEYTIVQTVATEGSYLASPITAKITLQGDVVGKVVENETEKHKLKISKVDSETNQLIKSTDTGFKIWSYTDNKYITTGTGDTKTDIFYTDINGYMITDEELYYGRYRIEEVSAASGYIKTVQTYDVMVSDDEAYYDAENDTYYIVCTIPNVPQKGKLTVNKTGEDFASVTASGNVYTPVYTSAAQADAVFEITAAEDIYTLDGTKRYSKDEVVDTVTTDATGSVTSKDLYVGKYKITEITAPFGFVNNVEVKDGEITYAGDTSLTANGTTTTFVNERQKAAIDLNKAIETYATYNKGLGDEYKDISFGLYANEVITAKDGTTIPKDGLIEKITLTEQTLDAYAQSLGYQTFSEFLANVSEGDEFDYASMRIFEAEFTKDIPFGKYYVKEISTNGNYTINPNKYEFTFEYTTQDVDVQTIHINNGEAIKNELIKGKVSGIKYDEETRPLAGATIGLFLESDLVNPKFTYTTLENGYFEFNNIAFGNYVVREIESPEGFLLEGLDHPVTINTDKQNVVINITNLHERGKLTLVKVDATDNSKLLPGAVYTVYTDANSNGTYEADIDTELCTMTDLGDGNYEADGLIYGFYLVKETAAPAGYEVDPNYYPAIINEHGDVVTVANNANGNFDEMPTTGDAEITKKDIATDETLPNCGIRLYDADDHILVEKYTDENGIVKFEKLKAGTYYYQEFDAPEGYLINEGKFAFTIDTDGQIVKADLMDTAIKGKLIIRKVDADTGDLIADCGIKVWDDNGNIIFEGKTDATGIITIDNIEYGVYHYQEYEAPDGYFLNDTIYDVVIEEDGKTVSKDLVDEPIPKTGVDDITFGKFASVAAVAGLATVVICISAKKKKED